jgi:hypothetical protein
LEAFAHLVRAHRLEILLLAIYIMFLHQFLNIDKISSSTQV